MQFRILLISLAVISLAHPQSAQRLTLSQAIGLALKQHPLLAAARERLKAAQGKRVSARALPNLSLSLVAVGTSSDTPVLLEQTVELPFKRSLRRRLADAELAAAVAHYRAAELDVTFAVKVAYAELQQALAVHRLTEEAVELMSALWDLAHKQYAIGAVPFTHVTRMEIERQRAEQDLIEAGTELTAKQVALNLALGQDPTVPVSPADPLSYSPLTASLERLASVALQQHPRLMAEQSRLRALLLSVSSARAQRFPEFFVLARLGENERAVRLTSPRLGIGVTLPFLDFGRIKGEVAAAEAQRDEGAALLEQTKRAVLADVEIATKRLIAASTVVEAYQRTIIPAAEDLLKRVQAAYAEGGSTLPEVLDAQQTWRTARKEFVHAIAKYRMVVAELERAVGGNLPSGDENDTAGTALGRQ